MLSFTEDQFINEQKEHATRWVVKLNNDQNVYYDDYRPGLNEPSSWVRLKDYCTQNNLKIKDMYLQFRSHYESLPPNKERYFFCKCSRGHMQTKKTEQFYIAGYVENGSLITKKYSVPALILRDTSYRSIEESEECLI